LPDEALRGKAGTPYRRRHLAMQEWFERPSQRQCGELGAMAQHHAAFRRLMPERDRSPYIAGQQLIDVACYNRPQPRHGLITRRLALPASSILVAYRKSVDDCRSGIPPTRLWSSRKNCLPSSARIKVILRRRLSAYRCCAGSALANTASLALTIWSASAWMNTQGASTCTPGVPWPSCPHRACGVAFKLAPRASATSPTYQFRLVRVWFDDIRAAPQHGKV
jgi:hypothetical protein